MGLCDLEPLLLVALMLGLYSLISPTYLHWEIKETPLSEKESLLSCLNKHNKDNKDNT